MIFLSTISSSKYYPNYLKSKNILLFYYFDPFCASVWFVERYFSNKEHSDGINHRRRINTEEKAKVIAAVWEAAFKFLVALAILPGEILKNRMYSIHLFFSNHPGAIDPFL